MDHRHLAATFFKTTCHQGSVNEVIRATYEIFNNIESFIKLIPILTGSTPEGTTDLLKPTILIKKHIYLNLVKYIWKLQRWHFGKVFSFGPTFRAEKSKTRRHLIEFWMNSSQKWLSCIKEKAWKYKNNTLLFLVQSVLDNCDYALDVLGRDRAILEKYTKLPFPRISYDDAVELLQKNGYLRTFNGGDDFGSPHETFSAKLI